MALAAREVVTTPEGEHFLVQAVPKGGLEQATPFSGPVTWLSAVPGAVGFLGLLVNKLVHRGRWLVLARPLVRGHPSAAMWRAEAVDLKEANIVAGAVIGRLRAGLPPTSDTTHC